MKRGFRKAEKEKTLTPALSYRMGEGELWSRLEI
jgi:hypothetical protein